MKLPKDVWLSKQLGFNAYNLSNINQIDFNKLTEKKIFITLKIKPNIKSLNNKKIKKYFKFIDINYQFIKQFKKNGLIPSKNIICRLSTKNDIKKIISISKEAFKYSRFQIDKRLAVSYYNKIQTQWIINYFNGKRANKLIVAENKNRDICGFMLIFLYKKKMHIDLIATSNKFQRKGVGKSMIFFAAKKFFKDNFEISVGTQKKNMSSIKFYNKLGFKIKKKIAIFHYLKNK